ncbi:MAG: hypothetical protein JEY99_21095 [Spirochaetales bacterium]|nr:hypothetical protein [Spirochaetales bacterium]
MKKIFVLIGTAVVMSLFFSSCGSGNIHEPLPGDFPPFSRLTFSEWQNLVGDYPGQLLRKGPDFPPVRFLVVSGESPGDPQSNLYNHVLNQEIIESLNQTIGRFSPDFLMLIGTLADLDLLKCPVYNFSIINTGSAEPLEGLTLVRNPGPGLSPGNASFLIFPPEEFVFDRLDEKSSTQNIMTDFLFPIGFSSGEQHEVIGYKGDVGEWFYLISTPPINTYPHPWRMVTIDERQIMNVEGGRFIPRLETGGELATSTSSMNSLYLNFREEFVPSIMMNYRLARKRAEIMAEYKAALALVRVAGEESGELPDTLYSRARELWMRKAPEDFQQMVRTLGSDQPPPDNRIQIDLVSGRWRSIL